MNDGESLGSSAGTRWIRIAMGILLVCVGLYAVLVMGLSHIFSGDETVSRIAMFLVFAGFMFALSGAGLVQLFGAARWFCQVLFGLCFVVAIGLMILGLHYVFSDTPACVYLLLVGFAAALISAVGVR